MDKQINKIKQMAVGCDRLQYLVDKTREGPEREIQPNSRLFWLCMYSVVTAIVRCVSLAVCSVSLSDNGNFCFADWSLL